MLDGLVMLVVCFVVCFELEGADVRGAVVVPLGCATSLAEQPLAASTPARTTDANLSRALFEAVFKTACEAIIELPLFSDMVVRPPCQSAVRGLAPAEPERLADASTTQRMHTS